MYNPAPQLIDHSYVTILYIQRENDESKRNADF